MAQKRVQAAGEVQDEVLIAVKLVRIRGRMNTSAINAATTADQAAWQPGSGSEVLQGEAKQIVCCHLF